MNERHIALRLSVPCALRTAAEMAGRRPCLEQRVFVEKGRWLVVAVEVAVVS